ncbi:Nrap protein [Mycotypha africana]|uniref:Nrap protein n=1 Tax=Mycotypha africana TaxID=64632 RepID=UPI0023013731|nr:Nrap protein [Mycotypha africana]KAI8973737.1 Nrap protein [Mycotypha africana]
MGVAVKRKNKSSNTSEPVAKQAKKEQSTDNEYSMMGTGFSDEDEAGDWESGSDDSDDDNDATEDLPSTEIKKTKPTEDDIISGELEGLKETAELYKSNIFKLEIEELLAEITPNYGKHKAVEKALHHLKAIFDSIPEAKQPMKLVEFAENMYKSSNIRTPFPDPQPSKEANHTFTFVPPASIHLVGGYALKTITKSTKSHPFNIDVAVEMPATIFQEKDYSNYRYFHKRACYLACLAQAIIAESNKKTKNAKKFKVEYSTMKGDLRRPILIVKPSGDGSDVDFTKSKCVIRILPYIENDNEDAAIPLHRLAPGKSCVKPATATPHYNASLLMDMSYTRTLAFLYQISKSSPEFKNAILLARTWILQRGLESVGLDAFLFSMVMAYLLQGNQDGTGKKLSTSHSCYQLFRGTLDFLAAHDFNSTPVMLGESEKEEFSAVQFQTHYDVVIVDPSGMLNLAAQMTRSAMSQVQHEAKLAMSFFKDETADRFDALFLKKVEDFKFKYDNVVRIPYSEQNWSFDESKENEQALKADFHHYLPYLVSRISDILQRGLTNRVDLVAIRYNQPSNSSWSVQENRQELKDITITIGLLLNSDNAPRLVDQGPDAANKDEVARFREFWGDKSELRRFKDGSIVESVVWQTQGYENRSLIVQKIVLHLLKLHLDVSADQLVYWAGQVYPFLRFSKSLPHHLFNTQELEVQGFQPVMSAYSQFSKHLRQLDDALPLLINNVYPAHVNLRYSSATIPHPVDFRNIIAYPLTARYVDAMDVVVHIESSAKFPDDLDALQKVKHAFLLKLAEEFKTRYQVDAVVVDDVREKNPWAIRGYLDVYYFGYIFRCHIHLEQEATLLQKIVNSKTATIMNQNLAKDALEKYMYRLRYQQLHTFYIQAMCAKYTAFSSTVRLVKRWFGAHLLSNHVAEEVIELIVAHVFLEPQPWVAPVSTLAAFSRVLGLLATWDWQQTPLIVDVEGELVAKDREEITTQFSQWRRVNPQLTVGCYTIATAKDHSGHRWSMHKPGRAIAARVQALARASVDVIETAAHGHDLKRVFVTPMEEYTAVLDVDIQMCGTRYYQNMQPDPKYLKKLSYGQLDEESDDEQKHNFILHDNTPYAQLDPVSEFVQEIEKVYGKTLLVFHNKYGGDKLALVWNPISATPIQWKVNAGYNSIPVDMNKNGFLKPAKGKKEISKMISPNFNAILAEIIRLGKDGILKV